MEGQLAQRRAADAARVVQHGGEVEAGAVDLGDRLAGDGVGQDAGRPVPATQLPGGVALAGACASESPARAGRVSASIGVDVGLPVGEQLGVGRWRRPKRR